LPRRRRLGTVDCAMERIAVLVTLALGVTGAPAATSKPHILMILVDVSRLRMHKHSAYIVL
jgi:hypothetical protein